MSIASSTSTAASSGSSMNLSIGMVFSRVTPPASEANSELRDYRPPTVTTISSIAKAGRKHLGERRKKADHWQAHKQSAISVATDCVGELTYPGLHPETWL